MSRKKQTAGKRAGCLVLLALLAALPMGTELFSPAHAAPLPAQSAVAAPQLPAAEPTPDPSAEPTAPQPPRPLRPAREEPHAEESVPAPDTQASGGEETAGDTPEPVGADYFADAVFLGDSRTEALSLYSDLQTPTYLYFVGATVDSVQTKAIREDGKSGKGGKTLLERLDEIEFTKLYIGLGVNELGWPKEELFYTRYGALIEAVRAAHPDARIALESILPVSAKQDEKKTYVNNARINEYNEVIQTLARDYACTYLDVAAAVRDGDGCLRPELTPDGVHPNTAGCRAVVEYLTEHPI